jgi:hypothetical protein
MEMVDITHCLIISKSIGILSPPSFEKLQHEKVFHARVSIVRSYVVLDMVDTHGHWLYISILLNCQRTIAIKRYGKFWSTIIDFRSVFSVQRDNGHIVVGI